MKKSRFSGIKPPFKDIKVKKESTGFYKGYSLPVVLVSKFLIVFLVLWALFLPDFSSKIFSDVNNFLLKGFNTFYILATGLFAFFCFWLAWRPTTAKRRLGKPGERPEFSNFSWFSMMFGAGLGVGLMVYATAEPVGLWGSNPEIVRGNIEPYQEDGVVAAFRYTFLHYGLHAWAIYAVVGLSLAYHAYRRDMPLTMRSTLAPLLGSRVNGFWGHLVDIVGVIATILGIAVTVGFGVSQLVNGVYQLSGMAWLMQGEVLAPSRAGLLVALILLMTLATLSAVSGVGRGIKYLSNLNLVLSIFLISVFIIFGAFWFALKIYGLTLIDYLLHFIPLSFIAYPTDTLVGEWQKGWTTFYWAWWIAFAPFVGLFLARISRGRTIREFVLGALIAPAAVCWLWMTMLGGTSMSLELQHIASGNIIEAEATAKLFETLTVMFNGWFFQLLLAVSVMLILTFLITSVDSGILVMNTIMAGGKVDHAIQHRIIWGTILTALIAVLLLAGGGGFSTLQDVMIIGAFPFSIVMILMCISLIKALVGDHLRDIYGVHSDALEIQK